VITLGVTGHQRLPDPNGWLWVRKEIESVIRGIVHPWVGLSSLAIGADQLFAVVVLESRNPLNVILPNDRYEETFSRGPERERYVSLLQQASQIRVLSGAASEQESYMQAGKLIVDESDQLLAVWDGEPAKGLGGTGDIVSYALASGKLIIHIDPIARSVQKRNSP
jgi:hypothetical protein